MEKGEGEQAPLACADASSVEARRLPRQGCHGQASTPSRPSSQRRPRCCAELAGSRVVPADASRRAEPGFRASADRRLRSERKAKLRHPAKMQTRQGGRAGGGWLDASDRPSRDAPPGAEMALRPDEALPASGVPVIQASPPHLPLPRPRSTSCMGGSRHGAGHPRLGASPPRARASLWRAGGEAPTRALPQFVVPPPRRARTPVLARPRRYCCRKGSSRQP